MRYWRQGCHPGERRGPGVRLPVCGWRKTGEAPPTTVQRPRSGSTDNGAEAEIEAVEGGRGAGGRGVGDGLSVGGDVHKGKEGVREVVEGLRNACGAGFGDKTDVGAVVGERRGQIKNPYTVPCP